MSRPSDIPDPSETDRDPSLTRDAVFDGAITLFQPARGYRFSLDSLLLADFVGVGPGLTVLDLGSGVGVIALIVARRMTRGRVLAVEIQPDLARLAQKNAMRQPQGAEVIVLEDNWESLTKIRLVRDFSMARVDLVVVNPPYRQIGSGRINPDPQEATARHELKGSLASAAETAANILDLGGRLAAVYPAVRLAGLLSHCRENRLEPKRLRLVHARPGAPACLALVEARKGSGEELNVEPPLMIHGAHGGYSKETSAILRGRSLSPRFLTGSEKTPGSP